MCAAGTEVMFLSAASVFFWEKKQFFTLIYKKIGNTLKPGTPLTKCQIPKRVGHRHCKVGHRHCKVSTLLTYGQNCSFFWYPSNAVSEPEAQRDFNWSELFFLKKEHSLKEHSSTSPSQTLKDSGTSIQNCSFFSKVTAFFTGEW